MSTYLYLQGKDSTLYGLKVKEQGPDAFSQYQESPRIHLAF